MLSCPAPAAYWGPWFSPVCRQLYSLGICKQLCCSWCNRSLEHPRCWGVLQSCEATAVSPQCAAASLQALFFKCLMVSPYLELEGWGCWAPQRCCGHCTAQVWEQTVRISQVLNRVKQLILDRRALPLTCFCGADISTCDFAVINRGGVYKPLFTSSQFTQLQ